MTLGFLRFNIVVFERSPHQTPKPYEYIYGSEVLSHLEGLANVIIDNASSDIASIIEAEDPGSTVAFDSIVLYEVRNV